MSLTLDLKFTEPAAPLFIEVESDNIESLFVVSTSQVPGAAGGSKSSESRTSSRPTPSSQLRRRGQQNIGQSKGTRVPDRRRPMKVVERTDAATLAKSRGDSHIGSSPYAMESPARLSEPQPSMAPLPSFPRVSQQRSQAPKDQLLQERDHQPLFLPGSQMSTADQAALRASGLGIDHMDADDFHAMMEDEGIEVGFSADEDSELRRPTEPDGQDRSLDDDAHNQASARAFDYDSELGPTQASSSDEESKVRTSWLSCCSMTLSRGQGFKPLFDD